MTEGEFIHLLIKTNKIENTSTLKEYMKLNGFRFYSKKYFLDNFIQLITEQLEVSPDIPIIQLLYTITEDIYGRAEDIPSLDDKVFLEKTLRWLKAIETLEYTIIDRNNEDYDIVDIIINEE